MKEMLRKKDITLRKLEICFFLNKDERATKRKPANKNKTTSKYAMSFYFIFLIIFSQQNLLLSGVLYY